METSSTSPNSTNFQNTTQPVNPENPQSLDISSIKLEENRVESEGDGNYSSETQYSQRGNFKPKQFQSRRGDSRKFYAPRGGFRNVDRSATYSRENQQNLQMNERESGNMFLPSADEMTSQDSRNEAPVDVRDYRGRRKPRYQRDESYGQNNPTTSFQSNSRRENHSKRQPKTQPKYVPTQMEDSKNVNTETNELEASNDVSNLVESNLTNLPANLLPNPTNLTPNLMHSESTFSSQITGSSNPDLDSNENSQTGTRYSSRKPKKGVKSTSRSAFNNEEITDDQPQSSYSKSKPKQHFREPKLQSSEPKSQSSEASKPGENDSLMQHSLLAADIIHRLQTDRYECMICTDTIRKQVAVWSCSNCFSLFHLFCVKKWSKSGQEGDARSSSWICPGCQYIYVSRPTPKCFCGKVVDPQFNPYLIPHSCGEVCGKKLAGEGCPHNCPMQVF